MEVDRVKVVAPVTGSRPQSFDKVRICDKDGCTTVISKYNKGPRCYLHAVPKKVRVRGVLPSEQMEKERQAAVCIICLTGNRGGSPFVLDGVMHISGDNGSATVCEA